MFPTMSKHLGLALATGTIFALGCPYTETNPRHCFNNEGDAYCAAQYPDGSRPYCESGVGACLSKGSGVQGCLAERPMDACYSPCGGRSTIDEHGACVMVEDSSTGTTSTGTISESTEAGSESSSTTGPMPCVTNEECTDVEAPFCGTMGECGTCEATKDPDSACAEADPLLPLCVGGACVACTPENPVVCDAQLLLCDGTTNACIPCTEHAQCGSGACELAVGTCFPEDFVVRVDGDERPMPPMLYESIADAVAAVEEGTHGVIVVHELDGQTPYTTAGMGLRIDGGKTIALLSAAGEAPIIQGTGGNPGLRVEGAGTILYMDGLRLRNGDVQGLVVSEAFAWLDRSRIVQNTGGGIVAEMGAELVVRNCFVGGNVADVDAIALDGSTLDMLYTTVVAGDGALGETSTALTCEAPSTVDVRNSILVAVEDGVPEIDCAGATITFTASENATMGEGNVTLGGLQAGWLVDLTSDFHLLPAAPIGIATTAQWQEGDPPTDIDGDPRPAVDGTPDYAGADVP